MKLLVVDTIEEAQKKISACVRKLPVKTEKIKSVNALNRILAEDIFVSCHIPAFRRSTVDGYAVIAANTAGAGDTIPVFLNLKGTVSMGKPAGFAVFNGECAYVPTGGMIPEGADAMVMVEYCETVANSGIIAVNEAAAHGTGIIERGDDSQKGGLLLGSGTYIRPQEIGALAAAGITDIAVLIQPAISIISTGDELVPPECEPAPGQIRDINTGAIKALAEKHRFNVISAQVIPDDRELIKSAVLVAMASSDIIIISGGSSQGEKDYTAAIIESAAKPGVFTHGLAIKPGKPTILGWDENSKTLFAGLPGHPVSAMMVFELLLGNDKLTSNNRKDFLLPARVSCNIPGAPGKTVCQPVTLSLTDGNYSAEPVFAKSGMITALTRADGFIIIDQNREGLKKDEQVMVYLFK